MNRELALLARIVELSRDRAGIHQLQRAVLILGVESVTSIAAAILAG